MYFFSERILKKKRLEFDLESIKRQKLLKLNKHRQDAYMIGILVNDLFFTPFLSN